MSRRGGAPASRSALLRQSGQRPVEAAVGGAQVAFDVVEVAEQVVAVGSLHLRRGGLHTLDHLVERGGQAGEISVEPHGQGFYHSSAWDLRGLGTASSEATIEHPRDVTCWRALLEPVRRVPARIGTVAEC